MEEILGLAKQEKREAVFNRVSSMFQSSSSAKTKKRLKEFEKLQQEMKPDEFVFTLDKSVEVSSKKPTSKWTFEEFSQSSRPDNTQYKLRHWRKTTSSPVRDYFAAKEVANKYPIVQIPDREFWTSTFRKGKEDFLAEYNEEEVREIVDLLHRTELRFVVVADRMGRPVEEIKFIYYLLVNEFENKQIRFDARVDLARRQGKCSEFEEKKKATDLKKLQSKLREVRDITNQLEKVMVKRPLAAKAGGVFFGSEDVMDLPTGLGKKFPDVKTKLGFSQKCKRAMADVLEAMDTEKQLKTLLKTVSAAGGGVVTPAESIKTEE